MRPVDDLHNIDVKFSIEKNRIDEIDTSDYNKTLLKRFVLACRQEGLSKTTILNHMRTLRYIIRDLKTIGYDVDLDKLDDLMFDELVLHAEDRGLSKNGFVDNYKVVIKKFYRHLYDDDMPKWVRNIRPKRLPSPVQPSDILTQDELNRMLDACRHPRDKALISVLADSGMRIGALATCRIKNIEFNQYGAIIYISKTSQSKKTTAAKGIPLTWSTGYLNQWLNVHPLKDDPDAPMWVGKHHGIQAIGYSAIHALFKRIGERAGIEKPVNPHSFRHFAITNWILDGLNEQEVKHRAGWAKGSSQMLEIYANFTDQDINNRIFEKYGLKKDERHVTLKQCPRCSNILRPTDKFCSQCSLVLDRNTYEEMQSYEQEFPDILQVLMQSEAGREFVAKRND